MADVLKIENLHVSFDTYAGEVHAVRGVSLHVGEGEVLAIVGESGCGKSVTAQTIMKLNPMPPARIKEGSIDLCGEDIVAANEKKMQDIRGRLVSMIFQDPMTCLNPTMKVGKQLTEAICQHRKLSKDEAKKEAVRLLEMVQIPNAAERAEQYPHEFSGGMRQRAMIAIALGARPKLLLADEPTTALDVTIQDQIMKLLNQLKQELGMSIILVTHDLGVIAQMCDRVAVMYAGQIVEMTDTVTLFSRPRHPYTYGLMGSLPNEETAGTTLEAIKGSPPNLAHLPEGCPFSPRCKYACDLCRRERPALTEVEPGHLARCHRLDVTASFQGLIEVPDGAGRKEDTPHG